MTLLSPKRHRLANKKYFIAATEHLATNERKDDVLAMEDRDFVLLNEGIKEDGDKNISLYPESEDDNKLANTDEEIQSKPASKGNTKFRLNFNLNLRYLHTRLNKQSRVISQSPMKKKLRLRFAQYLLT